MVVKCGVEHHMSVRKRIHKKFEKYPHDKKLKRYVDKLVLIVAVLAPVMALPQVFKIWIEKNASGVSLVTWITLLIFSFVWLGYGILHKEKPIITTSVLWIFVQILIVVGILRYG